MSKQVTKPAPKAAEATPSENSTAVATAPAAGQLATYDEADLAEYANSGMETMTAADILVPRLTIIQGLSPQLQKSKAEYIEGAAIGVICDVAARELFPQGVLFLPVLWRKSWIEWAPRNTNKGIVKIHDTDAIMAQTTLNEKNQPVLKNGNLVNETAHFYGFNLSANRRPCYIAMTGSQRKKAKSWGLQTKSERGVGRDGKEFILPIWGRTYMLTTAHESNNEGEWEGWVITKSKKMGEVAADMRINPHDLKRDCLDFIASIERGEARASMDDEASQGSSTEGAM